MTTDHAELLSALMDREDVDPQALAQALEDPEARRAVVAFAAMRRSLHAPAPGEHEWLARQASRVGSAPGARRGWRLAAAAALIAAGVGAGVAVERFNSQQGPPEPSRVVQLDPLPVERR